MHSATTSRRYIHLNQLHAKAWVGVRGEVVIDHLSSKSDNFPQKCALIGGGGGQHFGNIWQWKPILKLLFFAECRMLLQQGSCTEFMLSPFDPALLFIRILPN